ncbi:MAG: TonB-dependent receptor [Anaerolineae bacterium]|nr:TonB-dependent receptor [Gemmatimonadaceae bacterium]
MFDSINTLAFERRDILVRRVALAAVVALVVPIRIAAQKDSTGSRQLDTVNVTVTRTVTSSPLLEAAAVSITSAERVASSPVRILPDALRESPGVQVQQTNAGHGTVILRGMTGNQVLVLVDGIRLNTATVRDGPNQTLSLIDPEQIERIEIIRGPGSALYGSDAMGGVVNVVMKRPTGQPSASAALMYASSDDGLRAHAEGSAGRKRIRARAGATVTRASDLDAGGEIGVQRGTQYRSFAADAMLNVTLRGCNSMSLSAQGTDLRDVSRYDRLVDFRFDAASQSELQGPDAEFEFEPQTHLLSIARLDGTGCDGVIARRGIAVGLSDQREGRRQRSVNVTEAGAALAAPTREYQRDDTRTRLITMFVEPRLPAGTSIRIGGDVYDDVVSSFGYQETIATGARRPVVRLAGGDTIAAGRFPDGARSTSAGVYAHGAQLVGSRARLLGGVRADRVQVRLRAGDDFGGDVDATNGNVSAQVGVESFLEGGFSFSAHVGQGFRAPNIYDLSTVSTVPGGIVLPSSALGPERSITYDATVRKAGSRATFQAAVYTTRITGFVDRIPGSYRDDTLFQGKRVFRAANIGSARISGIEVGGEATLDARFTLRGQAFGTRGSQTLPGGGREPVGRIPPTSAFLAIRRNVGLPEGESWIEIAARGADSQSRLSSRDERDSRIQQGGTPGYGIAGVRGSTRLSGMRLTAGAENLFDRGYRNHGSGIDAPGRHVWFRVDLGS